MSRAQAGSPGSVGILGGGSAGFLAALALNRHLPRLDVEVIAADSLPPIGVGESTLWQVVDFLHDYLGLDRSRFYRDVRPTWELGLSLRGWGPADRPRYDLPFDRIDHPAVPAGTAELLESSLPCSLTEAERVPAVPSPDGPEHGWREVGPRAYHLENRGLIRHLAEALDRRGVRRTDARVDSWERGEDGGIAKLRSADGRTVEHDLWIDCAGFRSVLLGKALGVPWRDFGTSRLTDRAVLATRPDGDRPRPFTEARTLRSGWIWRIPVRDEDQFGYVFSSAHCTEEEAAAEMERELGVEPELRGRGELPGGRRPVPDPEAEAWYRGKRTLWRTTARRALGHVEALELVAAQPKGAASARTGGPEAA